MPHKIVIAILTAIVFLIPPPCWGQQASNFEYNYTRTEQARKLLCDGVSNAECLKLLRKDAQEACVGFFFGETFTNGLGPPATLLIGRLWTNDTVQWVFGTGVDLGYIWRYRWALRSKPCSDSSAYQENGEPAASLPAARTLYLKPTQHFLSFVYGPGLNIVALQSLPSLDPQSFSASISLEAGFQYQLVFTDTDGSNYTRKTLTAGISLLPAYGFARQLPKTTALPSNPGDGSVQIPPEPVQAEWHQAALVSLALRVGATF